MNIIGLIGSLLLSFCALPELIRTVREKKSHMGWGFLGMWFSGEILCFFYGMDLMEIPLIINYSFNIFALSIMFYYKIKY